MTSDNVEDIEAPDDAILVDASLEQLRLGAEKVLFEFDEYILSKTGERKPEGSEIEVGDTVVFEEDIGHCPAQIVAVKLGNNLWYVISTSEPPESGYPTTKDAMRAGIAEEKKLDLFIKFISGQEDTDVVEDVRKWKPDKRAEAGDVLRVINESRKKWVH